MNRWMSVKEGWPRKGATRGHAVCRLLVAVVLFALPAGAAQGNGSAERYENWAVLEPDFPSTGGGGVMIGGYRPVVVGSTCTTPFTATEPSGTVHRNIVAFDAVPAQGGTLCQNGRWRSVDGTAQGTTPLRVFVKDGVVRASP